MGRLNLASLDLLVPYVKDIRKDGGPELASKKSDKHEMQRLRFELLRRGNDRKRHDGDGLGDQHWHCN